MCHESSEDNATIIDSAAGWAAKTHFVRGEGSVLRKSIEEDVTIEGVRDAWSKVTDMSNATHITAMAEASGQLMAELDKLKEDSNNKIAQTTTSTYKFGAKDLALYALGSMNLR